LYATNAISSFIIFKEQNAVGGALLRHNGAKVFMNFNYDFRRHLLNVLAFATSGEIGPLCEDSFKLLSGFWLALSS
jgi:hypothetical protein